MNLLSMDRALSIVKAAEQSAEQILKQKRWRSANAAGQCKAVRVELCSLRRAFSKKVGGIDGIALTKPPLADNQPASPPAAAEKRAIDVLQRKLAEQETELRQLRRLTCRQGIVDAMVACFLGTRVARMTAPNGNALHSDTGFWAQSDQPVVHGKARTVGLILAEARSCTDSQDWASKKRRLMLTFHPDKLAVAASVAEDLVKSMQNHVLWN